ncbi:hypothetical protein SPBR_03522 [Sporothrix brasiliensis 5110]|uniref:Uncharacterized protein n=1 Tax=Sporothrix brasiliensis 5110 TaxID=1398154 RepID=A0A0C2J848_9PEZI|nr:uncharacterized protein SPBR_03522 [Sporothrix brasiliensis 5110]KIH95160.1 hypothetical protein SPBR_03522 [Sporothrix brasiliensis 5110]
MSDEELDRDWKPNGRRPQSTIARSFSLELMDIFRIENSVADLDEQVDKRKQQVTSQTTELEALEARIREMEAMLNKNKNPAAGASPTSPRNARPSINSVFADANTNTGGPSGADTHSQSATPRPLEHRQRQQGQQQQQQQVDAQKYGSSRPGTARASQQAVPGALPPTPVGSEDGDGDRY